MSEQSSRVSRRRLLQTASGAAVIGSLGAKAVTPAAADPGTQQWAFKTRDNVHSSPTVVDGTVFVGSDDGKIYAFDAETGDEQWAFETGDQVRSSPTVVDGTVFVGSDDGNLYAVDAETGDEKWVFETAGIVRSSPAVVDGMVFVGGGFNGVSLFAVDAETGTEQWSFHTGGRVWSSPTVVDGTVFVGSDDGNLYAVAAESGSEQWAFETDGFVRSSPTVVDGTVFVGSRDNNLYAVDAETGDEKWAFETGDNVHSSPTVVDGTVFVGSRDNNLYAVDAETGDEKWAFETDGSVWSSPTVVDGTVFVGSFDGSLYAVAAESGSEQWVFETDGLILSSPTVVNGTVFVGNEENNRVNIDDNLYAVDATGSISTSSENSEGAADALRSFFSNQISPAETVGAAVVGPILGYGLYRLTKDRNNRADSSADSLSNETTADPTTGSGSSSPSHNTTTIDDHRTAAETAIKTALNAKSNNNLGDAADAYSEAITEYQATIDALDARDTDKRAELEEAIDSTRTDLEAVKTRRKQQTGVSEALKPAERSLQEAIVAYIENNQTVARIRFRQARDAFEEAHETIAESENDLLGSPTEVSVQPDRELSSTTLRELLEIPEPAADALADAGIETLTDFESSDESPWTPATVEKLVANGAIEEDIATTLTLLSLWHGDESCEFNNAEAVARRQEQADYGFNHAS